MMDVDNEMENETDRLPVSDSSAEESSGDDQELVADGDEVVEEAAAVSDKRGRGRPRKYPATPVSDEVKVKKGRGRPRKSDTMGMLDGEAPAKQPRLDDQYKGSPVKKGRGRPKLKKDGRGRPRKVGKPVEHASDDSEEEDDTHETPRVKKDGRGRPRKVDRPVDHGSDSDEEDDTPKVKKDGRGRPRKVERPVDSASDDSDEEDEKPRVKKDGRGRPRKVERPVDDASDDSADEDEKPRVKKDGRGRPRKVYRVDRDSDEEDETYETNAYYKSVAATKSPPKHLRGSRPGLSYMEEDSDYEGGYVKKGRGRPKLKDGRGRPRKVGRPVDNASDDSDEEDEKPRKKKDGRGRPRKVDRPVDDSEEDDDTYETPAHYKAHFKTGANKKSDPKQLRKNKPRLSYIEEDSDSEKDMESGFESDKEYSPDSQGRSGASGSSRTLKGRGRPKGSTGKSKQERKKNSVKEEDVESRIHQIEAQLFGSKKKKAMIQKAKVTGRGRGRPPNPIKREVKKKSVPGRGRGRPPKPNKVKTVKVPSGRGRGRPKKNTNNQSVDATEDGSDVDSISASTPDIEKSIDSSPESPVSNAESPVSNTADNDGGDINSGNELCENGQQESQCKVTEDDSSDDDQASGSETGRGSGDVSCSSDSKPDLTGQCNTIIGPKVTVMSVPGAEDNVMGPGNKADDAECPPLFPGCDIDSGLNSTSVVV